MGEEDLIGFLVEARNTKQDAHQASFTVDYPHTVIYKGYSNINYNGTKCNDISDPDHEDGLKSVKCELGNPFGGNPGASTRLRFKKDDSLRSQNQTSFFLSISTTSEQPVWKPLKRKYTLKIKLNPRIKIEPYTENQQIQFKMVPQEDRITSNTINGKNYDSLEEVIGPKVSVISSKRCISWQPDVRFLVRQKSTLGRKEIYSRITIASVISSTN